MPSWNQVLQELKKCDQSDALDFIRRNYIKLLHKKTNRNIIAYYSGWLQKPPIDKLSIIDEDKNGFMSAIHGLNKEKGLDIILHTPGGDVTATESIVYYLKAIFGNNIRAIIPQIAMSAGTMIACACSEIIMGKQSNIGPIDPQFGGIPAQGVIAEFERAMEESKNDPRAIPIWQTVISKYHPTFIGECENAIKHSIEIVKEWLQANMLMNSPNIAEDLVNKLSNHEITKLHSRHIHIEQAMEMGLKIISLESDQELQDLVLTVHHAYMHTFAHSQAIKIIENHDGIGIISSYK